MQPYQYLKPLSPGDAPCLSPVIGGWQQPSRQYRIRRLQRRAANPAELYSAGCSRMPPGAGGPRETPTKCHRGAGAAVARPSSSGRFDSWVVDRPPCLLAVIRQRQSLSLVEEEAFNNRGSSAICRGLAL